MLNSGMDDVATVAQHAAEQVAAAQLDKNAWEVALRFGCQARNPGRYGGLTDGGDAFVVKFSEVQILILLWDEKTQSYIRKDGPAIPAVTVRVQRSETPNRGTVYKTEVEWPKTRQDKLA